MTKHWYLWGVRSLLIWTLNNWETKQRVAGGDQNIIIIINNKKKKEKNSEAGIGIMTKLGRGLNPDKAEYQLPPMSKMGGVEWSMLSVYFPRLPVRINYCATPVL